MEQITNDMTTVLDPEIAIYDDDAIFAIAN